MRTEYCGLINILFLNKIINLYGWISKIRNHGNLFFLNLKDIKGVVQLVIYNNSLIFNFIKKIKLEDCVNIIGIVYKRPNKNYNNIIKSGDIEIIVKKIKILNICNNKLFFNYNKNISEFLRLKYRILDLKSKFMQNNLFIRNKIFYIIRKFMKINNFIEIETPFLANSTNEGAKTFKLKSNINNKYYSLPQSPQLFKQILMISGFDKYYQIIKCFRNEDLRNDRQPEFTQLDCELSFIENYNNIFCIFENMLYLIFKKILNIKLKKPFKIYNYNYIIKNYGTDKPDLCINLKLYDLSYIFKKINLLYNKFIFLNIPYGIKITNNFIKNLLFKYIINNKNFLFYYKIKNINNLNFNFKFNLKLKFKIKIFKIINLKIGDLLIINISNLKKKSYIYMGNILKKIGYTNFSINNFIYKKNNWFPLWIINFPLFKKNNNKYKSYHHPFTSPIKNHIKYLKTKYKKCKSYAYDLIINGYEIGGGSIRNYKSNIQKYIFKILNINKKKYDFFLKSINYSAPPHAGFAIGLDRLLILILKTNSIRDVIAFPKTNLGQCLFTKTPS